MIRVFEKQLNMIFYTSNGDSNMYSLDAHPTEFMLIPGATATANTGFVVNRYAYDESTGIKYFEVSGDGWVKLEGSNCITADFQPAGTNSIVTVDKSIGGFSHGQTDLTLGMFKTSGNDLYNNQIPNPNRFADGNSYTSNGGLERSAKDRFITGFRVSQDEYLSSGDVFADTKLYKPADDYPGDNETPINKIIRINSIAPDYFDSEGNAVKGLTYNLGDQFQSRLVINTSERIGFKIGENQYVNIADANATPLMFGHFLPTNKGEN